MTQKPRFVNTCKQLADALDLVFLKTLVIRMKRLSQTEQSFCDSRYRQIFKELLFLIVQVVVIVNIVTDNLAYPVAARKLLLFNAFVQQLLHRKAFLHVFNNK